MMCMFVTHLTEREQKVKAQLHSKDKIHFPVHTAEGEGRVKSSETKSRMTNRVTRQCSLILCVCVGGGVATDSSHKQVISSLGTSQFQSAPLERRSPFSATRSSGVRKHSRSVC